MPVDPTAPDHPLPGASFLTAYTRFWQRYALFSGRASRSEYWWAVLANALVALVLSVLVGVAAGSGTALEESGSGAAAVPNALAGVFGLLLVLFGLGEIVPSIAISVRRLHDVDFSGWLVLLGLIPSVGGLILLVFHVLPGNPLGRRFDRGGAVPRPAPAYAAAIPTSTPASSAPLDAWPAGEPARATAPLATQRAAGPDVEDPVRDAWVAVGAVAAVAPRLAGQPSWRRVGYLMIDRPDGIGLLATDGLAVEEGTAALGPGAEVVLPSTALAGAGARAADSWAFALLASVARRIGASGMHLPSELEQHGVLSMAVPVEAPADWRAPDGAVGVLIGLPLDGVPEAVATGIGEVRLVGIAPLRPAELQRILEGGRAARTAIAGELNALPLSTLASPDRPVV